MQVAPQPENINVRGKGLGCEQLFWCMRICSTLHGLCGVQTVIVEDTWAATALTHPDHLQAGPMDLAYIEFTSERPCLLSRRCSFLAWHGTI